MDKIELKKYLEEGLSTRQIEQITGINYRTVSYWIKKYGLADEQKYKKNPPFSFDKIDSKEKAYVLGFILADASISHSDCEISVAYKDRKVVEYISSIINGNVSYDMTYDKKAKRFPRARVYKKIKDITKFTGGEAKATRHYPKVRNDLERYLMLGFFDGDGCVTWGYRKDRNRLWYKISFKSSLQILSGIQTMLLKKLNIATKLYPVKNEKCYCIDFCNKNDILKFLNFIYPDDNFIILERKYSKQHALRLELGENGEGHNRVNNTVPSIQSMKV